MVLCRREAERVGARSTLWESCEPIAASDAGSFCAANSSAPARKRGSRRSATASETVPENRM